MTSEVRIRVSLSTGEFELEGPESFIAKYEETTRQLLERLVGSQPTDFDLAASVSSDNVAPAQASLRSANGVAKLPEFGEAVHLLPRGVSGTDQILLAGFYASQNHGERTFATSEANKLLVEQGIRVANPSQSLKNNLNSKKVFKVGSRYKISREGTERVNELLGRA
jgi:hypothetical protein